MPSAVASAVVVGLPATAPHGKRRLAGHRPQARPRGRPQCRLKGRSHSRSSAPQGSCACQPGRCSREAPRRSQALQASAMHPEGGERIVRSGVLAPGHSGSGSGVSGQRRSPRVRSWAGKGPQQGRAGDEDWGWMEAMGEEEEEGSQAVARAGAQGWRGDAGGVPAVGLEAQVPEGPWQGAPGAGDSGAAQPPQEEDHYGSGGQLYWEDEEEEEGFEDGEGEEEDMYSSPPVPAEAWASAPGSAPEDWRKTSASSPSEGTASSSSAGDGSAGSPWGKFWARMGEAASVAAGGMVSALWPVLGFVELLALVGVLALQFLGVLGGRAVHAGGVSTVSFAGGVGQGGAGGALSAPWRSAEAVLGWQNTLLLLMLLVVAASRLILLARPRQGQDTGLLTASSEGRGGSGRTSPSLGVGLGLGLVPGVVAEVVGRGDLEEQVRLMEGDLSSTIGMLRALSRHVEKLGVHVRLTRRTLRDPMMQTAEQVELQGRQVEALQGSVVALQSNLEELQLIVVCVQDQCMRQFDLFSQALRNVQGQLKASQEKTKAAAAAAAAAAAVKKRPSPPAWSQDSGAASPDRSRGAGPTAPNGRQGAPAQGGRPRSGVRGSSAAKQRGPGRNGSFSAPLSAGSALLSSSDGPREDFWASSA